MTSTSTIRRVIALTSPIGLLLFLGCNGGGSNSSPTGPSCVNIAGTYSGTFANSCGAAGEGLVVIAQAGCNWSASFPGQAEASGSISGRSLSGTLQFVSPCSGTASASGQVAGDGTINGTYSGRAIGTGCCDPVSGSFTLRR